MVTDTMICGIHHTGFSTPDLERAIEFYSGLLGFKVVNHFEWNAADGSARWDGGEWKVGAKQLDEITGLKGSAARAVFLLLGNAFIEVFEYSAPTPAPAQQNRPVCDHGVTHIALIVDDVQAEYDRLKALGVPFHAPPREDFRAVYGRDPDGNVFELMEVAPDSKIALDI